MAMKRSRKIALIVVGVLAVVVAVSVVVQKQKAGVVAVQTGDVKRQDLTSVVTASGEIRPRHYVNINSQSFGKIVAIAVQEGERVRRGQVLLRLESVQPALYVEGQSAAVKSGEAAVGGKEAALKKAQGDLQEKRADLQRAQLNWERAQGLHRDGLIPQQEYDTRKAEYEKAQASVESAEAKVGEERANVEKERFNLLVARATLAGLTDELGKTIYTSPIDGVVTNLPVHVGEQVVLGIQNSPGSFLMTVADLAEVTAEVKVDETDIVNVKMGQPAEVTIDAFPNQTFKGRVTEIGTTALVRSTGRSTAELQTGTQEAKDFKVVITLDNPPDIVRPGLSTTSRITTATRAKVLAIPIQALTIRRKADIEAAERASKGEKTAKAATVAATPENKDKEEWQGVFVVKDGKARFQKVETGITGVTDIEITSGIEEGQKIVTGSYRVLRELRHLAKVREEKPGEGPKGEQR